MICKRRSKINTGGQKSLGQKHLRGPYESERGPNQDQEETLNTALSKLFKTVVITQNIFILEEFVFNILAQRKVLTDNYL